MVEASTSISSRDHQNHFDQTDGSKLLVSHGLAFLKQRHLDFMKEALGKVVTSIREGGSSELMRNSM